MSGTPRSLLLDTHTFLWWRIKPGRLTAGARDAIATAEVVFFSLASAWEIAIKSSLGRLTLPEPVERGVADSGFEVLSIRLAHTEALTGMLWHHRDPFDRMLIAQARSEGLCLVSRDRDIARYEVEVLPA